jgi:transcriptional regulator with AAA-type ATPase domain
MESALRQLHEVLEHPEESRLVGVYLSGLKEVEMARELAARALSEIEEGASLVLVYIFTGQEAPAALESVTVGRGVVLPALTTRPSDLAVYVLRMARIAAERAGRSQLVELSPEVIYALLAYDWPRNYKQLQEVVPAAIAASGGGSIALESLYELWGHSAEPVAPPVRLATLMQIEQSRYFQEAMQQEALSLEELTRELGLDAPIQNLEELLQQPLLRREYGSL